MYLKALEMQGFKSFPDKITFPFEARVTGVVGPNGCGKSNVTDAIRWVVGEQSSKSLRGGKMEDMIFTGTEKRRQTGFAQVSLILDNSDGFFSLEETEVMVTRKFYRSGDSEYFINKHAVRLRDVQELFMDTGLGKEGYAIIGQGKIGDILSIKSSQRREVFEEAAGIAKFRHQKEDAQNKLKKAEENLVRVGDVISELELQVKPLEQQSETAKKFLIFRDELRVLEVSIWLDQLAGVKSDKIRLRTDHSLAEREKEEANEALEVLYTQVDQLSEEMRGLDVEAEAVREELSLLESAVVEQEAEITILKNTISTNAESADRLAKNLALKQDRENQLGQQQREQQDKLEQIESRRHELVQSSQEKTEEARILSQAFQSVKTEVEQLAEQEGRDNQIVSEKRSELSALGSSTQEIMDQEEELEKEILDLSQQLQDAETKILEHSATQENIESERNQCVNALEGHGLKVESRQKALREKQGNLENITREFHALESKSKMLKDMEQMYEGFDFAVKKVMGEAKQGRLRNIHGPVAELLTVPPDFTVAIETALGGAMQHLVVGNYQDGKAVLEFLLRQKAGRATVLPLDTIKPNYLNQKEALSKEAGFVGIASELVGYDGQYTGIVGNLLGRVVVMENLDFARATAQKFNYQVRIVTLNGQVQNFGGSMTGGSANRRAGVLSRKGELEQIQKQILSKAEEIKSLEQETKTIESGLSGDLYHLELAQVELRRCEDGILKGESQRQGLTANAENVKAQLEQRQLRKTRLKNRGDENEVHCKNLQESIRALEATLQVTLTSLQSKQQEQETLQEESLAMNELTRKYALQLESLAVEESTAREAEGNLAQLLADMSREREDESTLIEDYTSKNEESDRKIQEKQEKVKEGRERCLVLSGQVKEMQRAKIEKEGQRNKNEKEAKEKNSSLLQLQRAVTLLEEKKERAELEESQILEKFWTTYELTHEGAKQIGVDLESVPKASRRIGELKRDIQALGTINIGAIEEFEKLHERYSYLVEQRDDALTGKKELEGIIRGIVKEMEEIFMREFRKINKTFGEVFVELFGGGSAEVVLDDENDVLNCGIEIRAKPPGKTLKILSLLSGGEKAFVAIALCFAILRIRPTPFVVLDEIDAALDDGNVGRYAEYLKKMSSTTQFIVISHRRGTMEIPEVLYGITMQEQGISRMLRLSLNEVEQTLNMKI